MRPSGRRSNPSPSAPRVSRARPLRAPGPGSTGPSRPALAQGISWPGTAPRRARGRQCPRCTRLVSALGLGLQRSHSPGRRRRMHRIEKRSIRDRGRHVRRPEPNRAADRSRRGLSGLFAPGGPNWLPARRGRSCTQPSNGAVRVEQRKRAHVRPAIAALRASSQAAREIEDVLRVDGLLPSRFGRRAILGVDALDEVAGGRLGLPCLGEGLDESPPPGSPSAACEAPS